MAGISLGSPGRKLAFVSVGSVVISVAGAVTGFTVVERPLIAWALVGIAAAALLMLAPPQVRVAAAVLTAASSRLVVSTGFVSSFANFVHYPLTLAVAILAAAEAPRRTPGRRPLEASFLFLLGVALASWLINGGDVLRPFLDWLVFSEPLLIVYAIITMRPAPGRTRFLWALALAIPLLQLPVAAYQAATRGFSDQVQGFFVGMGSGAHVAGAVSLTGCLVCVARALWAGKLRSVAGWLAGAGALFLVAIIADAKQVVIAFIPALVLLVARPARRPASWALAVIPIAAGLALAFASPPSAFQRAFDWTLVSRGALGKLNAFALIAERLSTGWARWIVGLGPGNSVSRVAMMGLEAFVKHDSPVSLLGLVPAATTVELWNLTAANRLFASSSVWSFVSSWLGLLGDLGLAGVAAYLAALGVVRAGLHRRVGWEPAAARSVFLMMVLLAFLYSWLEEPGYTVTAALVIGLGLTSGSEQEGAAPLGVRGKGAPG